MSELVEKVRGIIEAHITACEPPDTIARAAIAAVAEWLDEHQFYAEGLCATSLRAALRAAAGSALEEKP